MGGAATTPVKLQSLLHNRNVRCERVWSGTDPRGYGTKLYTQRLPVVRQLTAVRLEGACGETEAILLVMVPWLALPCQHCRSMGSYPLHENRGKFTRAFVLAGFIFVPLSVIFDPPSRQSSNALLTFCCCHQQQAAGISRRLPLAVSPRKESQPLLRPKPC